MNNRACNKCRKVFRIGELYYEEGKFICGKCKKK